MGISKKGKKREKISSLQLWFVLAQGQPPAGDAGAEESREDSSEVGARDERAREGGQARNTPTSRPATTGPRSGEARGGDQHRSTGNPGLERENQSPGDGEAGKVKKQGSLLRVLGDISIRYL